MSWPQGLAKLELDLVLASHEWNMSRAPTKNSKCGFGRDFGFGSGTKNCSTMEIAFHIAAIAA